MGVFRASQMVDCEIVGLIRCLLAAADITNASNGGCSGLTVESSVHNELYKKRTYKNEHSKSEPYKK